MGKAASKWTKLLKLMRRGSAIALCLIFFCAFMQSISVKALTVEPDEDELLSIVYNADEYESYLNEHTSCGNPEQVIAISGGDYTDVSADVSKQNGYEGYSGDVALTTEESRITWEVNVPEEGFYNLFIDYYPIEGKGNDIEREIYINGELPFDGSQYIEFDRIWKDETEITRDSRENDIRPKQVEAPRWLQAYVRDSEGYYQKAYQYYFKQGKNTITFVSIKEPMAIGQITLKQEEELTSYAEYAAYYKAQGVLEAQLSEPIKIQGESAKEKSDSTLYPIADRSSPLTEPTSTSKKRLNIIGGSNWKSIGQWVTWELDVPADGMYEIAVKYRQNIKAGVTVARSVRIDGAIPFREAENLKFYYKNDWQIACLGNDDGVYQFYLTAGTHTITMEVLLGEELSEIIRMAEDCVSRLNEAYLQLLMVVGSSPDVLRDYQFELKTPEALNIIKEQYSVIQEISSQLESYCKGSKGSDSVAIDKLLTQLKTMSEKPDTIAKQWSAFKDNIVSLGSWCLSMKEQPLEIDYLLVQQPGTKLPKAKAGFFLKLLHELKCFFASFGEDYNSIGEVYTQDAIDVWLLADGSTTSVNGGGRDQATILKNLVDNYFVTKYQIPVNVKLVNRDVLLSATLAGEGPDVALNVAGKEPVNYALRNAVADLTQFEDYEEVAGWFHKKAMVPFTLGDGVYALPQTTSFNVMFYRADILKSLGLSVPRTWDDFYECLPVIQKGNMNVGIYPDNTAYAMFLYQHGGKYYSEDGCSSALDSEEAIAAFKQFTSNYVDYKLPISFDFANRFRTGEMPLAIADYTNYNYLSVFAPEIRGLWGFTMVPAYVDANGNYNHSVTAAETASIILKTSDAQESAWVFLKWWMSEETQSDYCNEIENVLGVSGRIATANVNALKSLPWSGSNYRQLMGQMDWIEPIPEVAGGYFTERHVKNAFYTVYNSNEDPRETLEDFVKTIDNEITNKRLEFGLDSK